MGASRCNQGNRWVYTPGEPWRLAHGLSLGALIVTTIASLILLSTPVQAPQLPHHVAGSGVTLDGLPYLNSRDTPRSKPSSGDGDNGDTGGSGGGNGGTDTPPQTQPGGVRVPPGGGGPPVAGPVHPEEDGCWCGDGGAKRVPLYRAIGVSELSDVLKYGDYGIDPNGAGKYFSMTEEGARNFASTRFNAGKQLAITRIDVPEEFLSRGYRFNDPGGAGDSIHFAYDGGSLLDLYEVMSQPQILDAPWVRDIC